MRFDDDVRDGDELEGKWRRGNEGPSKMVGVVLAAGEGRRMGGAKALLLAGGRTLLERHVCRMHDARCVTVVVVVRPEEAGVVRRLFGASAAHVRIVEASTSSPAESLAAAVAVLDGETEAVLISPVDMRPVRLATVRALVGALSGDVLAASPTFRGQGGHPIVARPELLRAYASTEGDRLPPLRDVLAAAGDRRLRIDVNDEAVLGDLDTPADCLEPPRFLDSASAP